MARQPIEVERIAAQTVAALRRHISVRRAYIFGSYAQGVPREDSDIDIAVFSPAVEGMSLDEKVGLVATIQKEVGTEVELHLFSDRCLEAARPTNLYGHIVQSGKETR